MIYELCWLLPFFRLVGVLEYFTQSKSHISTMAATVPWNDNTRSLCMLANRTGKETPFFSISGPKKYVELLRHKNDQSTPTRFYTVLRSMFLNAPEEIPYREDPSACSVPFPCPHETTLMRALLLHQPNAPCEGIGR